MEMLQRAEDEVFKVWQTHMRRWQFGVLILIVTRVKSCIRKRVAYKDSMRRESGRHCTSSPFEHAADLATWVARRRIMRKEW